MVQNDGAELEMEEDKGTTKREGSHEVAEMTELSLKSLAEISSSRTMKLRGIVGDTESVVIIDSGVTHNFISDQLVHRGHNSDEDQWVWDHDREWSHGPGQGNLQEHHPAPSGTHDASRLPSPRIGQCGCHIGNPVAGDSG